MCLKIGLHVYNSYDVEFSTFKYLIMNLFKTKLT